MEKKIFRKFFFLKGFEFFRKFENYKKGKRLTDATKKALDKKRTSYKRDNLKMFFVAKGYSGIVFYSFFNPEFSIFN